MFKRKDPVDLAKWAHEQGVLAERMRIKVLLSKHRDWQIKQLEESKNWHESVSSEYKQTVVDENELRHAIDAITALLDPQEHFPEPQQIEALIDRA